MVGRLLLILFSLVASSSFVVGDDGRNAIVPSHRVALVVGNGAYDDSSSVLENPANDAAAIAAKLRAIGIEVIEAVDLDYKGMRDALRTFDRALQGADAGLFYYAGHAMEYRGRNYLVPTDAILETEGDVGLGLIDMDQVLQVMETSVPTRLVFLDACRNNPLARSFQRSLGASREVSVGRGLARIQTAVGTFIAYATGPGDVAADGQEQNSPFTEAMLSHLDEPGLEISQLMQRVRNSVIQATDEKQIPWDSSSLRGPFILNLNITVNAVGDGTDRAETVFWESIKGSERIGDFEAYIERFGYAGVFAPLAQSRIADLQSDESPSPQIDVDTNFDDNAFYRLTTKWQGDAKSLDIVNDGTSNNRPILAKTGSYSGQYWKFADAGNGYYRLTTKWQGDKKSLDIVNDGTANNRPILAKTGNYSGQYWKIADAGNGYYRLSTMWQGDEKSLDIINDGTANNIPTLAKAGNYSGQYWKIEKVDFE